MVVTIAVNITFTTDYVEQVEHRGQLASAAEAGALEAEAEAEAEQHGDGEVRHGAEFEVGGQGQHQIHSLRTK